jgi:hypothetical protein
MNSPCIKICKLDIKQEYCIGCNRTLQEIRDAYINPGAVNENRKLSTSKSGSTNK